MNAYTPCVCNFACEQTSPIGSFENEALENEDRSTKHPKLENEACCCCHLLPCLHGNTTVRS